MAHIRTPIDRRRSCTSATREVEAASRPELSPEPRLLEQTSLGARGRARQARRPRSAFDVFVEYTLPSGGSGFIGIEVKYHENLKAAKAELRPRHDEVGSTMGCFSQAHLPALRAAPLEQIWRDHLLAGSMLATGTWAAGLYVFLYPEGNVQCARAAGAYAKCPTDRATFEATMSASSLSYIDIPMQVGFRSFAIGTWDGRSSTRCWSNA